MEPVGLDFINHGWALVPRLGGEAAALADRAG
jgi:hypothetical protein